MYLGIDVGTSAVKIVLMDSSGAVAASASSELTVQSLQPLWSEQDPETWWTAVCQACCKLAKQQHFSEVKAIGLSGQMHGAVCLDADLQPLRPAILWNDGRSQSECAAMLRGMPGIGQMAGVLPMPGFTGPKLRWLAKHEPDCFAGIRHVLLPKDYIRLKLTGDCATDMSDAAGTMWLDQRARWWSDELCRISGIDPAWLPGLHEGVEISGVLTGEASAALGLKAGIPVAAGGSDGATGAMGIGAVNEGDAFISLGTSGQLFVASEQYRPEPGTMVHAFAHCVPDRWFQMAVLLNGAGALNWWSKASGAPIETLLGELSPPSEVDVPLFLPYLTGERTPHNDPDIRDGFYGLGANTGRGTMTEAVLDAIAYTLCDARDALAGAGTTLQCPAVIGGGARSDHLLQTISNALGIPLRRLEDAETGPALGAARLAMIAAGDGSVDEVAVAPPVEHEFQPGPPEIERHAGRLDRFRNLYQALKPLR